MLRISKGWFENSLRFKILHQSFNYLGPCSSWFYVFEMQSSSKIDLTENFRSNYHGKGRNEVNRAKKKGINFMPIEYTEFIEYSIDWARSKKLKPANKMYLSSKHQLLCTKTFLGNRYLSAHVYVLSKEAKTARLLYSVTNLDEDQNLVGLANRLNHDSDFEHLLTSGYDYVDLGGIGSRTPGITRFKRSFGGIDVENVNAYSIVVYLFKKILRF